MTEMVPLHILNRNPDVLSCIANLSNDEVFTPPEFANQMLDLLGDAWGKAHGGRQLWADSSVRFLDPFTKSGVFLREITARLIRGLEVEFPDLQDRVDHILSKQVFGIAITQITALIARRSLYCSKRANGKHSVSTVLPNEDGNIWFQSMQHTWDGATEFVLTADAKGKPVRKGVNGRCKYCGASQRSLDRGQGFETHAYAFIHTSNVRARVAEIFGDDMQFDVIIGNPPYQLDDGGHNNSATPIYHLFVEQAMALDPRYLVMVTPSRWFAGGRGLEKFRQKMLTDGHISHITDYPKLYDGFPGVKIRGGISYFLWERDYQGPATIQTMWDGKPIGEPVARPLDQFDVFVRRNEAIPILEKILAKGESKLSQKVSSQKPFGLRTFFHGAPTSEGLKDPVKLYGSQRISWIERSVVEHNTEWINKWKVLMSRVQGTSAAVERIFLGKPIISGPNEACTETYLVAGLFDTEQEARRYATYLRTRFVRFLVSLRKSTQDAPRGVYGFVPDIPLDRDWVDADLYKRYSLSPSEIEFIESQIGEHDDAVSYGAEVGDE